jgi:Family of unknown function (DUF6069)
MSTATLSTAHSERVSLGRLLWVGPLAVAASVGANVLFALITNELFGVSPEFPPLTPGAVAVFTAVLVFVAVGVFALVARFARRPIRLYQRVALIALLISFIPDLALPFMESPVPIGTREVVLLMLTHVVAAAVCLPLLTALSQER